MMVCDDRSKVDILRQWFASKFCLGHQCDSIMLTGAADVPKNGLF